MLPHERYPRAASASGDSIEERSEGEHIEATDYLLSGKFERWCINKDLFNRLHRDELQHVQIYLRGRRKSVVKRFGHILGQNTQLRVLHINVCCVYRDWRKRGATVWTSQFLRGLSSNRGLLELGFHSLSGYEGTGPLRILDVQKLLDAIPPQIERLEFSSVCVCHDAFTVLCEGLAIHPNLKQIALDDIQIVPPSDFFGTFPEQLEAGRALAHLVNTNLRLQAIKLVMGGNIPPERSALAVFLEQISCQRILEKLELVANNGSDWRRGILAKPLIDALQQNRLRVRALDLDFVRFSDKEAAELGQILQGNSDLVELSLRNANLSGQGMEAIFRSLRENNTLRNLSINCDRLEQSTFDCLKDIIRFSNSTLLEVGLGDSLDDDARKELQCLMDRNQICLLVRNPKLTLWSLPIKERYHSDPSNVFAFLRMAPDRLSRLSQIEG